MRIVLVTVFAVLLGEPAFAQMPSLATTIDKPLTQDEVERRQKRDEGYRAGLNQIPDQRNVDPWGNVRGGDKPARQGKPAANPK